MTLSVAAMLLLLSLVASVSQVVVVAGLVVVLMGWRCGGGLLGGVDDGGFDGAPQGLMDFLMALMQAQK